MNHAAFLGEPEPARLHGGQRPIGLPALQPPMGGTLGGPLRAAGEVTPAAAGHQDLAQRLHHLTKRGMGHAATPLRWQRRKHIGKQLPLHVTQPFERASHGALLMRWRALEHGKYLSGIGS